MGKRAVKKAGRAATVFAAVLLMISAAACESSGSGQADGEKSVVKSQEAGETLAEGSRSQTEPSGTESTGIESSGAESIAAQKNGTEAETQKKDENEGVKDPADGPRDTADGQTEPADGQIEPADGQIEPVQKNWIPVIAGAALLVLSGIIVIVALRRKGKKDDRGMNADNNRLPPAEGKEQDVQSMADIPAPFGWEDGGFAVRIGNAHHIGARENQQDSFSISDVTDSQLCRERGIFAVVADGMGGLSNGAQVSATVTSSMQDRFLSGGKEEPSMKLLEMLHYANRKVNDYLKWNPGTQSGSTVVAVLISGTSMHFISVGDSRIYLCRGKTLTQLNREHTYASDLDEKAAKGEISLEDAATDPQRKALTSYIGMGELAKIDRSVHPFQLVSGDKILLMSDGVFGTLTAREIWEAVQTDAFHGAERIEQMVLAKHRASQDNFTAVVIECVGGGEDERI